MKKKGFTLIELIAVLVILAILALIVTPLVMNIIRKARISADKRSIDAYGRSVELAIATYLLDNGDFPTSIDQLTIEYTGDRVECSTTQLNSDSSVYLTGCTVGGRSVYEYTYGSDKSPTYTAYVVGDEVTYNNADYYVIKDSGIKESNVTLLKAEPLTVDEVNLYGGVGTQDNHVNINVPLNSSYYQQAYDSNGYGGMQYYSSSSCGYNQYGSFTSDCKNDYESSEVKYVVDSWTNSSILADDLVEDEFGYKTRLITINELRDNLNYSNIDTVNSDVPIWVYSINQNYWTMSLGAYDDSVWSVLFDGLLREGTVYGYGVDYLVRPVITIKKISFKLV